MKTFRIQTAVIPTTYEADSKQEALELYAKDYRWSSYQSMIEEVGEVDSIKEVPSKKALPYRKKLLTTEEIDNLEKRKMEFEEKIAEFRRKHGIEKKAKENDDEPLPIPNDPWMLIDKFTRADQRKIWQINKYNSIFDSINRHRFDEFAEKCLADEYLFREDTLKMFKETDSRIDLGINLDPF